MGISTEKYIRKPLYVSAVRITGDNFEEIATWCQGEIQLDDGPEEGTGRQYIHVRVHNPKNARQTKAFVGDWILYTERGYKVYTNKAFHDHFDTVTAETATYPYTNGDVTVLGPDCFVQKDGSVLCWKGVNYTPQTTREDFYMGHEEVLPGITVSQAVERVRANGALSINNGYVAEKDSKKAV